MEHFRNTGFGWTCKRCGDEEQRSAAQGSQGSRGRFFHEGEAEARATELSTRALARWRDDAHTILYCPRCGVEETFAN
jgi:hypothetical protein